MQVFRKPLKWLCDWLIEIVYGFDPDKIKGEPQSVKYIPDIELRAGVTLYPNHETPDAVIRSLGAIGAEPHFKTLAMEYKRSLVNDLVSDAGEKSERLKGMIEAIQELYECLQVYAELSMQKFGGYR